MPLAAGYSERSSSRLRFLAANGTRVVVRKTSEQMFGCNGQTQNQTAGCYLGLGFAGCQSGCVAKALREAAAAGTDPSLALVDSMYPAMVYDGGFNREDPAHSVGKSWGPQAGGWNAHTWVGSRSSSTDAVFDSNGGDVNGMGYRKTHLWRCAAGSGPDGGAVRSDDESIPRKIRPVHRDLQGQHVDDRAARRAVGRLPSGGVLPFQDRGRRPPLRRAAQALPFAPRPHLLSRRHGSAPMLGAAATAAGAACARCEGRLGRVHRSAVRSRRFLGLHAWPPRPDKHPHRRVPDMEGSMYQDVHFRVTKYNASGAIVDARYCKCSCRHHVTLGLP